MRFQATVPAPDGFERAASRASRFLIARGYRPVRRAAGPLFRRGSLAGSVLSFSPRRWAVRVSIAQKPSGVEALFQINASFQMITEGERAFWADEAAGVLAAIEGTAPPPPVPTQARTALVLRVLGPILAGALALGLIAGGLGGLMRLALRIPGNEQPPDFARDWEWVALLWDWGGVSIWNWMALGAFFGAILGLTAAAADPDSLSPAVGGPMPEGEALQLLVGGVRVDKSLLDVRPVQGAAGTAAAVVTQRSALPAGVLGSGSRSRRASLAMSIVGSTLKAVVGAAFAALGGLLVWEAIAVGRELGRTDTSRILSLLVEHKEYVGVSSEYEMMSFYGRRDLRLRGRVVETNEPAEVAVEQKDFDAAVPGQSLDVYRLRGAAPEFVARSKYKRVSPLIRIPGIAMGFHWALLVGGYLIAMGVGLALERSVDDEASRNRVPRGW